MVAQLQTDPPVKKTITLHPPACPKCGSLRLVAYVDPFKRTKVKGFACTAFPEDKKCDGILSLDQWQEHLKRTAK